MTRAALRVGALLACGLAASCAATVDTSTRLAPADVPAPRDAASDAAPPDDAVAPPDDAKAPPDDAPPLFDPASPCVTDMRWTRGNRGSAYMNPGLACIACHARMRGPRYYAAGTLFYAPHEEDLCDGFSGDPPNSHDGVAEVHLVDANGTEVRMPVNQAGNFYTRTPLTYPLQTVEILGPTGHVSAMQTSPPNGDCNGCHTQDGVDTPDLGMSPGRLTVPL